MASLFDMISKNLKGGATAPEAQAGALKDNTAGMQTLLRARGGKAVGGGTAPALSNLTEQMAASQAAQEADRLAQEAKIADVGMQQQLAQAKESEEADIAQLDESRMSQQDEYQNRLDGILNDFSQQGAKLDFNKNRAKLEQAGFLMRLSDDKYLTNLEIEGRKNRLESEAAFDEALARAAFADEFELMRDDLEFRAMIKADDRKFREELANMDINTALALASAANQQAAQTQMWSGLSTLAQAGAQAFSNTGGSAKAPTLGESIQAPVEGASGIDASVNTSGFGTGNA